MFFFGRPYIILRQNSFLSNASIAQWIEYPASNRVVTGSSPVRCILPHKFSEKRACAVFYFKNRLFYFWLFSEASFAFHCKRGGIFSIKLRSSVINAASVFPSSNMLWRKARSRSLKVKAAYNITIPSANHFFTPMKT